MTPREDAVVVEGGTDLATPRPWFWDSYSRIYGSPPVIVDGGDPEYPQVVPLPTPTRGDVTTRQGGADAALIVSAVNAYDRLRRVEAAARALLDSGGADTFTDAADDAWTALLSALSEPVA